MKYPVDKQGAVRITVVGAGYVGMAMAVLLGRYHPVTVLDIDEEKIRLINANKSPVHDRLMEQAFAAGTVALKATTNAEEAYHDASFVIVCVGTNYDEEAGCFNTEAVESVTAEAMHFAPQSIIVIKSTVPTGMSERLRELTGSSRVLFSPEFLRESSGLYDCLHPSRIIVGTDLSDPAMVEAAETFAALLSDAADDDNIHTMIVNAAEAKAIKLFSNTFLAMRVAFFNELDTFAERRGLDTAHMIEGVCSDPRIGDFYNNPSFGYGGYCLPKDTKQLLHDMGNVRQRLFSAIVNSNHIRMDHIAEMAAEKAVQNYCGAGTESADGSQGNKPVIGVFRIVMKTGSDNFRESAVTGVLKRLQDRCFPLLIYEPLLADAETFMGCRVINDLDRFKEMCSCIIANRYDPVLDDVKEKVYTRDVFRRD